MKYLKELVAQKGMATLTELVEDFLKNNDELEKNQKRPIINTLNHIFDGFFLEGFSFNEYGNFLSRSLTAYVISNIFGIDPISAAQYITDDNHDYCVDALYYKDNKIYVFQTKFSKSLRTRELREVKTGIQKLLNIQETINDFNPHIREHYEMLYKKLLEDDTKIVPVCIFFGDVVPEDVRLLYSNEITNKAEYDDFIEECKFIGKKEIFEYGINPQQINKNFVLDNFFYAAEPIKMYSGCIKANFLKELFLECGVNLFNKNIRFAIKDSAINIGIQNTIETEAQNFLYYHNGITFICERIVELPISASSHTIKNLSIVGLSVVNGAQTISSLATIKNIGEDALIQIRIIETQDPKVVTRITQYNNSQNSVSAKDLRTLDPIHQDIKKYFLQNGFYYVYRTGDIIPKNATPIMFEDLMIGLACFYKMSKMAKINKGQLWENEKIYNALLCQRDLELFLRISRIKQAVDKVIENIALEDKMILHYNRLILEIIFRKFENISAEKITNKEVEFIFEAIKQYIDSIKENIATYHRKQGAYESLISFCSNEHTEQQPVQQNLF